MFRPAFAFSVALTLGAVASARAADPAAPPPNYACLMVGTTAAYRPPGGPWDGLQKDVSPLVGYGRYVTKAVALEMDVGPTFVKGRYTSFGLVPAVVWTFSSHAYLAARFLVPVDPETNFGLFPGVGAFRTFGRYSPYVELNVASYVGRGHPDLGVSLTAGVLISF
jgi:hypothetical protein